MESTAGDSGSRKSGCWLRNMDGIRIVPAHEALREGKACSAQNVPAIEPWQSVAHNCYMRDTFLKVALRASHATPINWYFAKGATLNEDLPMPLTESMTLCQYCERLNHADARFCVGCGAQMHLVPCPTCGAVNDKTAKSCYQCHGELRETTEILVQRLPAAAPDAIDAAAAKATPTDTPPSARQRQPLFVVLIIFAAFTSAAFFAYRQRIDPDRKLPVDNVNRAIAPVKASDPGASIGAINKLAPATIPPATTLSIPPGQTAPVLPAESNKAAAPPATATIEPPAVVARQRGNRRAVPSSTANPPETAAEPKSGIEKKAPPINACTEAIAALGLCNPTPTKGK